MNPRKRIPATLTAILAILALTACGETPKGDGQGTVNNPDPGYVRWYGPPQPRHRTHPTSPKGHPPTRTGQRSDHLRDLRRTAHRQHVIHLHRLPGTRKGLVSMHTTWANDPVNSPNHYTRSHPGMECIELTADTSFCLGNAIKYLWRYHSKGRPVEDLEKARWYLCHVIDHDEKIAWTRQQHAILDTLANDPAIPDAEAHTWAKLRQGFPYSALACLDRLIEHERNQQ